jgi:hypothetical protein
MSIVESSLRLQAQKLTVHIMQISFKTLVPLPMSSVYQRFEDLLPLRYPLPGWSQPYPIAYTITGGDRYRFMNETELVMAGAIDDTYRPDLLGNERFGLLAMTFTLYAPDRIPLGTVQLSVPDGSDGWTALVVAPSAELPQSYYECRWFIVEVVQTFATQLRQAALRSRQIRTRSPTPVDASPQDLASAAQSTRGVQEQPPTPPTTASPLRSRSRARGGRPRNPIDDWAWEQVHVLGQKKAVVFIEWQRRNAMSNRSLSDPERSFKHAIALDRRHPHDVWAWEQVHREQRPPTEVFGEWQQRNQHVERELTDPERTFAFVTARDRPPGMEATSSK